VYDVLTLWRHNLLDLFDTALVGVKSSAGGITIDDTDLKAYWKFNEASGDIINVSEDTADLGTGADFQVTGATYGATGIIGDALSFDGTNDFAEAGSSTSQFNFLHNQSFLFTISWWSKRDAWDSSNEIIFSTANEGASSHTGILIRYASTNGSMNINFPNGTNMNRYFNTFTGLTQDTDWHHFVLTGDVSDATDTLELWQDGVSLGTTAKASSTFSNNNASDTLHISQTGASSQWRAGDMDETAIFNRRVSDSEVADLYNSGSGTEIY